MDRPPTGHGALTTRLGWLEGAIRHYDWGSHQAIARLQGRAHPTSMPEAELWFGAHPIAPAVLHRAETTQGARDRDGLGSARPLDAVVAADVDGELGGLPRLPYLVKILAAAAPLSIQVHPDAEQAAAGHAEEARRGLPIDDPRRRYPDPWAKPEALIALGRFEALAGFRAPAQLTDLVTVVDSPRLAELVEPVLAEGVARYPQVVARALRLTVEEVSTLLDDVERAAAAIVGSAAAHGDEATHRQLAADLEALTRIAARHPDDPGVLVALLLHRHELATGDALVIEPGCPHAYLRGTAIEVMGASDNVLRAGLTSKHVDVDEFLAVMRPARHETLRRPAPFAVDEPERPADAFAVTVLGLGEGIAPAAIDLEARGPEIIVTVAGSLRFEAAAGDVVEVRAGQACWVPADVERVAVSGRGRAVRVQA